MFDETHNILYMKVTVKDTPKDLILEGGIQELKGNRITCPSFSVEKEHFFNSIKM